jgi:hypothetical protein
MDQTKDYWPSITLGGACLISGIPLSILQSANLSLLIFGIILTLLGIFLMLQPIISRIRLEKLEIKRNLDRHLNIEKVVERDRKIAEDTMHESERIGLEHKIFLNSVIARVPFILDADKNLLAEYLSDSASKKLNSYDPRVLRLIKEQMVYRDDFMPAENDLLFYKIQPWLLDYLKNNPQVISTETKKESKDPINKSIRLLSMREGIPLILSRVIDGTELLNLMIGSHAEITGSDTARTRDEAKEIGNFLQDVHEYMEMGMDLEPSMRINAAFELTNQIALLEELGFFVFFGIEEGKLEGGDRGPRRFTTAIVQVLRQDHAGIVRSR